MWRLPCYDGGCHDILLMMVAVDQWGNGGGIGS